MRIKRYDTGYPGVPGANIGSEEKLLLGVYTGFQCQLCGSK